MKSRPTGAYVLDSWALLAFVGDEPGSAKAEAALRHAEATHAPLFLSVINAGEVYYRLLKGGARDLADEFVADLRGQRLPIRVIPATNTRVWEAARIKAAHTIAYADAFAAALAREVGRPVLTGDAEFAPLERAGVCQVAWIGGAPRRKG
jgi:predicted nucleic acid-binding protein